MKHPNYYQGAVECWDYIYGHNLDFFEGNVVKYVTRWRGKGGVADLVKAREYLDKLIELENARGEVIKPDAPG